MHGSCIEWRALDISGVTCVPYFWDEKLHVCMIIGCVGGGPRTFCLLLRAKVKERPKDKNIGVLVSKRLHYTLIGRSGFTGGGRAQNLVYINRSSGYRGCAREIRVFKLVWRSWEVCPEW